MHLIERGCFLEKVSIDLAGATVSVCCTALPSVGEVAVVGCAPQNSAVSAPDQIMNHVQVSRLPLKETNAQ